MAAKNRSNYSNNNGSRGSLRSIYARMDLTLSSHIFFRIRYAIPLWRVRASFISPSLSFSLTPFHFSARAHARMHLYIFTYTYSPLLLPFPRSLFIFWRWARMRESPDAMLSHVANILLHEVWKLLFSLVDAWENFHVVCLYFCPFLLI